MAHRNQEEEPDAIRRTGPRIEPWQFEAVREAGLAVASELSLDKLLQKLVDLARDLVKAQYAALGVAREDRRGLSRFIVSGISEEKIRHIPHWPVGLGLLGILLREPKPLRVRQIGKDPRSIGFPPGHPGMTNFLGVPVVSKGKILGNFYLTNKEGADEFSEADESLIVLFAAHAAVAIENATLYTETNERLKQKIVEVERAEQRSTFLAKLSGLLFSGPQSTPLSLAGVAAQVTEVLGDACAIHLLDPEHLEAVVGEAIFHSDPSRAQAAREFLDKSWGVIKDNVIEKHRPIFVADVNAKPLPYIPLDPGLMRQKRFSAAVVLPLMTRNRLYGVLTSLASVPITLTDDDFGFVLLVAERIAVALENATLFQELTAALKLRDEFISVASHELKTPITILKGYAQAVAKAKDDPELRLKALEMIVRQADRLNRLVNELLDVARIRAGRLELHRERIDLAQLAGEIVQRFEAQVRVEGKYRLVVEVSQPEIWGAWDPSRLDQVLTNLLSNAIKYSPAGGEVKLGLKMVDEKVVISASDQGIGIPRQQQDRVFEPFFRANNVTNLDVEGTGLGLHITKQIVERHGGRIWFESEERKGTTFFVELPLATQP